MMSRSITFTVTVAGTLREVRTRDGASVAVGLTDAEQHQLGDETCLLREAQGARVPLDMPAVDGLRLELVPFEEGEGPFAPPTLFNLNRFGETVTEREMRQIRWVRHRLGVDPEEIRIAELRARMRELKLDVLYVDDEDDRFGKILVDAWPDNLRLTAEPTRSGAERALHNQAFDLALLDLKLGAEDLAGLTIAQHHRDRIAALFFVSAYANDHRAVLVRVRPDAIRQKPTRSKTLLADTQKAFSMVLEASP